MRPLNSRPVQIVLAWLFAGWMSLCVATMRWRRENTAVAALGEGGIIVAFWHSRIGLSPAAHPDLGRRPMRALISLSRDGEFIAGAVARLGFPAIRGSSAKVGSAKAKGGSAAFRDSLRWIRSGGGLAMTPDGPRGPAEQMAEGAPALARAADAPVLLLGMAARPAIRLNSWDRALLPLPFSRGAVVWELVQHPGREIDDATVAADWAARLTAVTTRAEALLK